MGPLASQAVTGIALQFASYFEKKEKKKKISILILMNIKWLPLKVKQIILGFTGRMAHLTVLEGYYDLSLKPHSRVPFMARRASAHKDAVFKSHFHKSTQIPQIWLRQRFSECCLVAGRTG